MKKALGFALCLLGTAFLILWGVLWSLEYVGTDAELYRRLQFEARGDILSYAGISEEDLVCVNAALAECLRGDAEALSGIEAEVFGEIQPAFNEREMVHMEDCRKLFELARTVKGIANIFGLLAVVFGFALLKDRKKIVRAAWLGPIVLVVPLGLLAAWAAVDFNAAFNFFHEVLFTNDLWLLDPGTDLLIRICPQKMFMNMGLRIGVMSLIFALATPSAITIVTLFFKRMDNGDVNNGIRSEDA